jgi:hypothetical protein
MSARFVPRLSEETGRLDAEPSDSYRGANAPGTGLRSACDAPRRPASLRGVSMNVAARIRVRLVFDVSLERGVILRVSRVRFLTGISALIAASGCAGSHSTMVPNRGTASIRKLSEAASSASAKLVVQINKRGDLRVKQLGTVLAVLKMPRISAATPASHPLPRVIASGKLSVDVAPQKTKITGHHTFAIRRTKKGTLRWYAAIRPVVGKAAKPKANGSQSAARAKAVK